MLRMAPTGSQISKIHLTKKEAELLNLLQQHAGTCLSREFLLRTIWNYGGGVKTRTLDVHIQRLRRKLAEVGEPGEIQTILRNGYCWRPFSAQGETRIVA